MDEGSSSSRNGILRKWVHSGGVSRVAYSPDGAVLYTTAGDFLRVWSGDPKDNAAEALGTIDYHQEATLTLDCSMESLVTGCEDGQVALFHHGTRDFAGLLTRSVMGMPIRSVRFSPNGQRVAVASDELIVKVVDVRDTSKMQVLEGHTKGVRGLTWSPDGQLITTSSSDGTIRVWDVSNPNEQEPTCIKVLDGLIAAEEPESEMQCEAVWHPSGRYFVVGTKSHEIAVVSKETWEREGAFEKDGHNGDISTLTFSPNGRYLCSASRDSSMIVWDCTARKPILRESLHGLVTSAAWRPGAGSNSITFIETSGYVSRWDDVISTPLAHPNDAPQSGAVRPTSAIEGGRGGPSEANPDRHREKSKKDKQRQNGGGPSLFDGDVEVEGDASADEKEDDDDDDLAGDLADLIDDGEVDDFIEDDDDENVYQSKQSSRKGESEFRMPPPLSTGRKDGREKSVTVATSYGTSSSLVRGQDPFQPGATPLKEKRRYLAFNMIGVLHIVERETHNIVTIDFHDQSSQASDHFDDYTKYDMGALGTGGAVYASSPASKLESSSVKYRPFQTWNSISAEWTIDLPVGETVTALAVGGGNNSASAEDDMLDGERLDEIAGSGTVVVATNRRFLRFLSGSGMQKYLMNFGEEIVTMTGGKEMLLIVHRAHEIVKPGYQELSYTLLDLDNYEILQRGPLPLLKGAKLAWAGFSEDQMPYIFDSTGLLSALERSRRPFQGRWVPVLDTMTMARREGKQESYWPVGVSEANFMCIILKGEEKFPYFPTPITTDLPVSLPLLEPSGAKTEIESKLLQTQLFCSHARDCLPGTSGSSVSLSSEAMELKARVSAYDLEMDKSVLKLVQLACKSERQQQALDLARSLSTSAGLSGAIKIASLYSLAGLVQKFENLRDVKEGLYGSSAWRDREAQKKREGKYAHLADFATVPDSALQIPAGGLTNGHPHGQGHANGASGANLLSMPFDNSSVRAKPKKTARNVFSAIPEKPRAPLPTPTQDSEMQDDESSYRYDEADGDVMDESQDSMRAGSTFNDDADGSVSVSAGPISKPRLNPFAKSAQPIKASSSAGPSNPVSSGPMNPFAKKAAPGGHGLKKTGSFFDRVDASNGTGNAVAGSSGSGSSTGSGSGSKQSTLFGLPAGSSNGKVIPEKKSARGKKRKSGAGAVPNGAEGDGADDGDDGVEVSSSVTRKIPKKLDSFFSKGPVASSSSNSKSSNGNSNGLKRTPSKLSSAVVSADSAEEDVEETQMATAADSDRETEEPDPARLSPTAEEDEEEPLEPVSPKKKKAAAMLPSRNDGLSKLEQFKFKAPAAVVSAQEAEEDVLAAGAAAGIDGDGEEDM